MCVVGGGFTGLSAALHLAEYGAAVALVEADRIADGASGRNGGQIHRGLRQDLRRLVARFGRERGAALWQVGCDAAELVRNLVRRHSISCELTDGLLEPFHRPRVEADARGFLDALEEIGGADGWRLLTRGEAAAALGTDAYFGALRDARGGHLDPYRFALGLAAAAERAGAALYEESAALRLVSGASPAVETAHGRVHARHVILATDGAPALASPGAPRFCVPILSLVVATERLEDEAAHVLPGRECAADTRFEVSYWRKTADDRLIFGGGEAAGGRPPADIAARVRPHLARAYPRLARIGIAHAWAGTVWITANRLPFVREAAPRIWSAGGYSGQGVALAPMLGKLLADKIAGGSDTLDLIASISHRRLPEHPLLQGPLVQLGLTFGRLRDRL